MRWAPWGSWVLDSADSMSAQKASSLHGTNQFAGQKNNLSVPQNGSSPEDPCSFPQEA